MGTQMRIDPLWSDYVRCQVSGRNTTDGNYWWHDVTLGKIKLGTLSKYGHDHPGIHGQFVNDGEGVYISGTQAMLAWRASERPRREPDYVSMQLWEPCSRCGQEPVGSDGLCADCRSRNQA